MTCRSYWEHLLCKTRYLTTYRAILRGNRLEWSGNERQHPPPDRPVAVYVTVLDEPVVWERETRQYRALPGRDN